MAEFKRLEAERDELRRLLGDARRIAQQREVESTAAESRSESDRAELGQATQQLKRAKEKLGRQADELVGQQASIQQLTGERNVSRTRAERLQVDIQKRTLELHEKKTLLAWVLNASVDGILVYRSMQDEAGAIVDFECVLHNPAATRLYGLDGLVGMRLLKLHPDIRDTGLWAQYLRVVETGEPFEGEYGYDQGGTSRWFRVLAIQVASGLAITFSDISPRKQMEAKILRQLEELRQADRMKNEFLAVISHELRTPINGMMGFIGILEDGLAGPLTAAQHALLFKALESSERLLSLVNNMLDLSQILAGKLSVEQRPTQFGPIAAGVLATLADRAPRCVFVNQVPAELPLVMADEGRTAQVLTNLLDNAIKFSPEACTITARASTEGAFLRCEVTDTGIGMGEADLAKLFQVFTQLDMSNTREVGGAGLGLSLAKYLVEAQGGTVGVSSQAGEGSTFWFTLPLA